MKHQAKPVRMSVREAIEAFPDEWVLMDTGDAAGPGSWLDAVGEVLCHAPNRRRVNAAYKRRLNAGPLLPGQVLLFEAVLPITTGEELRKAIAELKERGTPVGWRRW